VRIDGPAVHIAKQAEAGQLTVTIAKVYDLEQITERTAPSMMATSPANSWSAPGKHCACRKRRPWS
jgi:hypothetical protein